jgi:plasmid stabilization system protein ParE
MPRLTWTLGALQDVRRLKGFISPHNPQAAKRAVAAIRRGVARLVAHPQLGQIIDGVPPDVRQLAVEFDGCLNPPIAPRMG